MLNFVDLCHKILPSVSAEMFEMALMAMLDINIEENDTKTDNAETNSVLQYSKTIKYIRSYFKIIENQKTNNEFVSRLKTCMTSFSSKKLLTAP